jgi:hypothetical protein
VLLGDIVGALRRRWILSLMCLAVVMAVSLLAAQRAAPTYKYSSTLLLLPPSVSRVVDPSVPDYTHGNPLFYLSSLDQTRDILIGSMTSSDTQRRVAEQFTGATFTAAPDILGSGPVIVVTVEASSDRVASDAITGLTKLVPIRLASLQAHLGVERSAAITARPLTTDREPTVSHKKQIRSVILTAGGLGLLCLFLIGFVDSLAEGRASRRDRPSQSRPGGDRDKSDDEPPEAPRDSGRHTASPRDPVAVR